MQHRKLFRISLRNLIHDVESKIEFFRILETDIGQRSVFIFLHIDPVSPDAVGIVMFMLCFTRNHGFCGKLRNRLPGRVQNDRVEAAVLVLNGDHAMRRRTVVINAVAGT